jgi:rod shape-determining protein MreD
MIGQLTGFFSGIIFDFISASPLGLNAFIRTLTGALAGLTKGSFFLGGILGAILIPVVLCAGATLCKAGCYFLLHILFAEVVPSYAFNSPVLWAEVMLNSIVSPFLFAFLKLFSSLLIERKEI